MSDAAVNQLRVVLVAEDFDAAVGYYRDTLGLSESAAIAGPDGARVVILEAGRATLELANAGAGANTTLADHDPTGHGEVAAIRDATRRTGSPDLADAVVYSSCEPCAICRTVAAAAGVREIVFAVDKEAVPAAIDPTPDLTVRLIHAVTAQLPGIARRGDSGLSAEDLTAPFRSFVEAAGRG